MKTVNIKGQLTKVLTIGEVAKLLGRQTITLRKFEDRGILPRSNFRLPPIQLADGNTREGQRIYSETLAKELVPIFAGIKQGVQVSEETKQLIREAFVREKNKFI